METSEEKLIDIVSAYPSGGNTSSIIVVIPAQLKVKAGTRFYVKQDKQGRIIYEPIEEA